MLKIVLIRPGATDYDTQERIQGALDIPLNEQGLAEAAQAAEQLRTSGMEVIYAPASEPAHRTAETIAETLEIKMRKIGRLENLNHGLWQGMQIKDVRRKQPKVYRQWQEQPENVCPPEGEMLDAADQRVRQAMMKLLKKHKEGIIGVCVPEPLLSLVRRFISHAELGNLWNPMNGHERFEILDVQPEEVLVKG